MFGSLQDGLQSAFKSIRGRGTLSESNMRDGLAMVEQSLLDADVSYDAVKAFMEQVTNQALGASRGVAGAERVRGGGGTPAPGTRARAGCQWRGLGGGGW